MRSGLTSESGNVMNTELVVNTGERMPDLPDFCCMGKEQQAILAEVVAALDENRLDLPALPDMARRFQELVDDPNVPTDKMVDLLSTDPMVSMCIIRAANSAALSNGAPVSNLRSAILRMGYRMLRGMVMNITMTKLFRVRNQQINQQLIKLWKHSRDVAANSYVLAQQQRHLMPEDAMLAGLVHDIGELPFYLYADRNHPNLDPAVLHELACSSAAFIGSRLLQSWNFADKLVKAATGHGNQYRIDVSDKVDYADVVTVANFLALGAARPATWGEIYAAERLGYYAADRRGFSFYNMERITGAKDMLGTGAARHQ